MDAIKFLKADHDRITTLLKQTEKEASPEERRSLFDEIAREIRMHETVEETVLYPALKAHPEGREIVLEGYEEHHLTEPLVRELEATSPTDERWNAKLKVLTEALKHHIKEEHDEMFPKAERIFAKDDRERMGTQMEELKRAAVVA